MAKTSTKSKRQSANPPLDPSKTRPLALTIPKNGFTYEQVLRDGDYAIYKQRLNAESDKPVRGCLAFEVWRIQVGPESMILGNVSPQRERGPSNEDFGAYGWTYPTLERAKAKMQVLIGSD